MSWNRTITYCSKSIPTFTVHLRCLSYTNEVTALGANIALEWITNGDSNSGVDPNGIYPSTDGFTV